MRRDLPTMHCNGWHNSSSILPFPMWLETKLMIWMQATAMCIYIHGKFVFGSFYEHRIGALYSPVLTPPEDTSHPNLSTCSTTVPHPSLKWNCIVSCSAPIYSFISYPLLSNVLPMSDNATAQSAHLGLLGFLILFLRVRAPIWLISICGGNELR